MQLDMSPVGPHWYRSVSSPFLGSMQICPLRTLSIVLETGFHMCTWLSFHLLLLRESDQCLLPKWPGKGRETGTNYILMSSQRLLHVHLDSTQFGRLSAGHTHSMRQERLVIPSQISHSRKLGQSISSTESQRVFWLVSLPTLVTKERVSIGSSPFKKIFINYFIQSLRGSRMHQQFSRSLGNEGQKSIWRWQRDGEE